VTPRTFRVAVGAALGSLCVIILTGALVRLTGSGLGCSDWPRCNESKFVDVSSGHTAIEQLNRLFTGVVSATVIAAVLLAHRLRPARRDLVLLAWGLVVGVLAQVVIGGIVVLTGLNPFANMAHFLVSMVLVACGFALHRRAGSSQGARWWRVPPVEVRTLHAALFVTVPVAIVTGTVVTATGPHAGDENAVRFGFSLVSVVRVHSVSVITTIALVAAIAWKSRNRAGIGAYRDAVGSLMFVGVLQAAVGWTQYFTGVPVILVAVHIAGATAFWLSWCALVVAPADDENDSDRDADLPDSSAEVGASSHG